ncbi:monocarboxylate transporter 14 isoform X2 [Tribolium castaneum]
MGLSATQGSLIINLNAAFGMIMGLFNGLLLKVFGYRKIAMTASLLTTLGIIMTAYSSTFTHFMISYGLITSLGMGMNMSAYSLALNSYFRKNRGKAVGYAMTITGLGPILMPQLINVLMKMHAVQGVTLILAGIAAHSFVAASLLQPVKWHLKTEIVEETKEEKKTEETKIQLYRSVSQIEKKSLDNSNESLDGLENGPIYGLDSALAGSVMSLHSVKRRASVVSQNWKKASIRSLNAREIVYNPEMTKPIKKKTSWERVSNFFDLDLFKDPIYVNIMIGLSLAVFAEINFSLLTAFILNEFGLTTDQIATFMSILGIADIIFRFLAPYIGQFLNLTPRPMYVFTLFMLMVTRFSLLISNNYFILLGVALGLGIAKGIRTVYMSLVIPTYVPIEKLASAGGLQMMVNGFCILIGGPIIGKIRDITGSYTLCIVTLNCITFSTIVIWTMEAVIRKINAKKSLKTEPLEQSDTLL